jgi:hypothetical protein
LRHFADLLTEHLDQGTGNGGTPWTVPEFAEKASADPHTVGNWMSGRHAPVTLKYIDRALFGSDITVATDARDLLRRAYLDFRKSRTRSRKSKTARPREAETVVAVSSPKAPTASRFTILGKDDLKAAGWSMREVAQKINKLDYQLYDGLDFNNVGNPALWQPILTAYPQNWRILVEDNSEVIGYWQTAVFLPGFYQKVKAGKLIEGELTPAVFELCEIPGIYSLYFISVCLDRERSDGRKLALSFFSVIDEQAKDGVLFDEVLTIGYSDEGLGMCESFKLEGSKIKHIDGNEMYVGRMSRILERCRFLLKKDFPELIDRYRSVGLFGDDAGVP